MYNILCKTVMVDMSIITEVGCQKRKENRAPDFVLFFGGTFKTFEPKTGQILLGP